MEHWQIRLSVAVYHPGDYTRVPTRVPTGTRSDIVKASAEHRPGPLQVKSGGPGGYPACFSSKIVLVSLADPDRGPAEQITGLNRGIFLAGAR